LNGGIFLYACWLLWIFATFFMNKSHPKRLLISAGSLCLLALIGKNFSVFTYEISFTYILLLIFSYYAAGKWKGRELFFLLSSVLVGVMLYVGITLVGIVEHGLFLVDPIYCRMIGMPLLFTLLLPGISSQKKRWIGLAVCLLLGEGLLSIILHNVSINDPIGEMSFLDEFVLILSVMYAVNKGFVFFGILEEKMFVEKEKPKIYE